MRHALIPAILLVAGSALAQPPEWGLVISPAFSKARLARGFIVGYAGPPLWSGNLIVEERTVPGFSLEIFREKPITRIKHVSVKTALGFLTGGSYQHFDYDYANSINNIVSIENRYGYLTFDCLAKYNILIKNMTAFAGMGPHLGYLIYSQETSKNLVNGENTQRSFNFLSYEKRINYGSHFATGIRFKRISAEVFYRSYYRLHYNLKDGRRVFNYGLAVAFYFQKNKTESK